MNKVSSALSYCSKSTQEDASRVCRVYEDRVERCSGGGEAGSGDRDRIE